MQTIKLTPKGGGAPQVISAPDFYEALAQSKITDDDVIIINDRQYLISSVNVDFDSGMTNDDSETTGGTVNIGVAPQVVTSKQIVNPGTYMILFWCNYILSQNGGAITGRLRKNAAAQGNRFFQDNNIVNTNDLGHGNLQAIMVLAANDVIDVTVEYASAGIAGVYVSSLIIKRLS